MFEQLCPQYMSYGMTYEQFWDGDPFIAKAIREKYEIDLEQKSFDAWLTGLYVYEALLDASPMLNGMSKRHKAFKYTEKPHALTDRQERLDRELRQKAQMEQGKALMYQWAQAFNRGRREKKGAGENGRIG